MSSDGVTRSGRVTLSPHAGKKYPGPDETYAQLGSRSKKIWQIFLADQTKEVSKIIKF